MSGLYGSRWQKFRRAYLAEHPLCVMCKEQGKAVPATVVDHVVPHRGDPVKFWAGPFQALCKTHHDGAAQARDKSGTIRGCDANGVPLDGAHWWRR